MSATQIYTMLTTGLEDKYKCCMGELQMFVLNAMVESN